MLGPNEIHIRFIRVADPDTFKTRTAFRTTDVGPCWQVIRAGHPNLEMKRVIRERTYAPKYIRGIE